MSSNFFDEPKEQSKIKSAIVSQYFRSWAKIMIATQKKYSRGNRIAYVDLFAGRGRYADETKSTPILVLETALQDDDIKDRLVTVFNDADEDNSQSLEEAINQIPNIATLRHKPDVWNQEVGDNLVREFETANLVPTFSFVDPWGYKGLSLRLVNSVLKDWGCDCVFFFNYNRINAGIGNEFVEEHINALLGDGAERLRDVLPGLSPTERESAILEELAIQLKKMGGKYVLPFRFRNERGTRTSHYLVFVTKNFRGYDIMKQVMAAKSSESGSFEYNPATERQPFLFRLSRSIEDLGDMLVNDLAGQQMSMEQIYERHSVDTPFLAKDYKAVLKKLESEGKVIADPPASKRKKDTFAKHVMVTFPD